MYKAKRNGHASSVRATACAKIAKNVKKLRLTLLSATAALTCAAAAATPRHAAAANGTWSYGGGDFLWTNPANWAGGVIPGSNAGAAGGNNDVALINTNPPLAENVDILVDNNRN